MSGGTDAELTQYRLRVGPCRSKPTVKGPLVGGFLMSLVDLEKEMSPVKILTIFLSI